MSAMNPVDLAQAASSLLANLIPAFGIVFGVSVLIGLSSYMLRALRAVGDPTYNNDEDEMPMEKPKNKAVGMNADGEIVYSELPETPFFYQHEDSKLN